MTEDELALARMEDDGYGWAIGADYPVTLAPSCVVYYDEGKPSERRQT